MIESNFTREIMAEVDEKSIELDDEKKKAVTTALEDFQKDMDYDLNKFFEKEVEDKLKNILYDQKLDITDRRYIESIMNRVAKNIYDSYTR